LTQLDRVNCQYDVVLAANIVVNAFLNKRHYLGRSQERHYLGRSQAAITKRNFVCLTVFFNCKKMQLLCYSAKPVTTYGFKKKLVRLFFQSILRFLLPSLCPSRIKFVSTSCIFNVTLASWNLLVENAASQIHFSLTVY